MDPGSHERGGEARTRVLLKSRDSHRLAKAGGTDPPPPEPAPDRWGDHANGLPAMSEWTNVAAASEIGPGEHRVVDIDDVAIAVFNLDGAYFAIEDVCTHDFGTLTGGCVEGGEIMCPRHGARFDIRTGEALTPPAYEPVATFPVRIHDGIVQVRDD